MATRARKRQKTDPSPTKPDTKTLFHFFSKPAPSEATACIVSPQRTESEPGSLHDQPRRKSDLALYNGLSAISKAELAPTNECPLRVKSEAMEFVPGLTECQETCSPTKEDRINPFECFDVPDEIEDDSCRDEDFGEDEPNFPYEGFDETFDPIEVDYENPTMPVKPEDNVPDTTVDEGPSCPFCSFSFKGLSENVLFRWRCD